MIYKDIAGKVLRDEANAIIENIKHLDNSFDNAIKLILYSKGRVITTGMGKSGHIANKVAATLASTGTPAIFLHPAEGIHGDLGMITDDDIVLAFSNSGETNEILNLLPSIKRIGAHVIAVVGNLKSTLANFADFALYAGVEQEADPLNLAPTSSTTVALALGDAIAISLLQAHHFTAEQFAVFHPGGSLGKKLLLTVGSIMHQKKENPIILESKTVQDALFIMTDKGLGAVSIIDEAGKLRGLLTDGDIRRGLEKGSDFLNKPVTNAMTKKPETITKDKLATFAMHIMEKHKPQPITILPVVDCNGKAIGMVHITDLIKNGIM